MIIVILAGIFIVYISRRTSNNLIEASEISGKYQEIGIFNSLTVSFELDDDGEIETDFFLVPTRTSLTVKCVEGNLSNLEILLYDTNYPDYIQSGFIESVGDSITFTNLFGGQTYFIKVVLHDGSSDKLILRFSK